MIVDFTAEAESDLESIGDYIARDNSQRALSFVRELRDKCQSIGVTPHAFPLLARYEASSVRRRVHGNFLIFYRAESARVVILHVLHGATDYMSLLFPADE